MKRKRQQNVQQKKQVLKKRLSKMLAKPSQKQRKQILVAKSTDIMINIGESNNRPQKTVNFPAFKKNVGTSQIQTTWLSVKKFLLII